MHSFDEWFDSCPPSYGQTHRNVAFFAWTAARKCQKGLVMDICKAYEQGKAGTYAAYPLGSLEHIAYGHGVSAATDTYLTLRSKQAAGEAVTKSPTVELALFEEENETTYPGYTRLYIPYDAWCWDMDTENLLVNRKNIDFAQSTKDYYGKVPITHIRATVDGKAQMIKLSRFLSLGPESITPFFSAGQLHIVTS